MSSKYWAPPSLVMEGNTSDIQDHCCMEFDGEAYVIEGFWCCNHCHRQVLSKDEVMAYNKLVDNRR